MVLLVVEQVVLGNVFEDEIEELLQVLCDRDSCNCKTDIIMNSKKNY